MAAKKKKTNRKKSTTKKTALVPLASKTELTVGDVEGYEELIERERLSRGVSSLGWPFVGTRGGRFTIDGAQEEDFECVVLAASHANVYYTGSFDPADPAPPTCWAVGLDEAELAPPADLPGKQSDTGKCEGCTWNAYGTDNRGRGKACKNTVRLAAIPFHDGVDLSRSKGVRLSISPTNVAAWTEYVDYVTEVLKRPVLSVVTRISIRPHDQRQIELSFEAISGYGGKKLVDVVAKRATGDAEEQVLLGFPASTPEKGKAKKKTHRKVRTRARG